MAQRRFRSFSTTKTTHAIHGPRYLPTSFAAIFEDIAAPTPGNHNSGKSRGSYRKSTEGLIEVKAWGPYLVVFRASLDVALMRRTLYFLGVSTSLERLRHQEAPSKPTRQKLGPCSQPKTAAFNPLTVSVMACYFRILKVTIVKRYLNWL